ncbi:uncharacterized protein BYT42DRAFT_503112 [Radiomyces spectabilis]|uniref:uncharacterized protein n=1 Tax=Radiomyces spectabilis TaxID=64574 RepID=UPI00221E8AF0|nr:uncharacterized protein BYT42DRAFT_503112 [Radiomyces spectabilis]KAI8369371.1 hypothetical protein BYT42DRAFT_503112 [Radiomyces spectabilis]
MSGSDIRDILQIEKPTEPVVRRLKQPVEKRPEGISRELYSLIGGTPSVAFVQPAFRGKFNVKKKALPWVLHPFTNPARADELTLHHWIKANDTKNDVDYPFAVLDDGTKEISYTAEEYDQYLKDPDWTKEDTDYLFRLCQQYDLRFPVIEDRYEFGTKKRTVEDLKARYCNVYRQLLKARSTSDNWQSLAQHYQFDKDKEIERKEALNTLFKRTKVEMEEEEALLVESKRIEQNEARLRKEREHVLQSLHPTVAASGHVGVTGSSPAETKVRKEVIYQFCSCGPRPSLNLQEQKRKKSSGDDATSRKKRSASTTPVSAVEGKMNNSLPLKGLCENDGRNADFHCTTKKSRCRSRQKGEIDARCLFSQPTTDGD